MATYYFDFDNGDDANDGSTPALALKNLCSTTEATAAGGNADFEPQPGDNLYLKRGSLWSLDERWHFVEADSGTSANPINVSDYGDSSDPQPIVEVFKIFESGDWTESATTGVWYADMPTNSDSCRRCFFNFIGQKPGATSAATCTADTPWWFDDTNDLMYVYSGSSDPTTTYTDVRCNYSTTLAIGDQVLDLNRSSYINFSNITFRGGELYTIFIRNNNLASDVGGFTFNNCRTEYSTADAMKWRCTVDKDLVGDNIVENCTFDMKWASTENDLEENAYSDGIMVEGGVNKNLIIRNNTIKNFGHSGININNQLGTVPPVDGIEVYGNYITCPDTDYGRGISINGKHGNAYVINCKIYQNLIYDTATRNQIEGTNTYFFSNIIDTVRQGNVVLGYDYSDGLNSGARSTAAVDNVVIANNLVINTTHECFRLTDTPSYPIDSITIANNIFINTGTGSLDKALTYTENDVKGAISVKNNLMYNADTDDVITWDGTDYTVTTAEAALSEMENNLQTDAKLSTDGDYFPDVDSPCLGAGAWLNRFVIKDHGGRPYKRGHPAIGAWERTSRDEVRTGVTIRPFYAGGAAFDPDPDGEGGGRDRQRDRDRLRGT